MSLWHLGSWKKHFVNFRSAKLLRDDQVDSLFRAACISAWQLLSGFQGVITKNNIEITNTNIITIKL